MKYYEGRFLIYDSETGFRASNLTEDSLQSLGGPEVVALKIHEATGLVLPFMKRKSLTDKTNYNFPVWFKGVLDNASRLDPLKVRIKEQLVQGNIPHTDEDIDALFDIPLKLDAQRNSPVSEGLLAYTVGDMPATTLLRRRIMVDDVPYKHPNTTLIQQTNTDPVGVRLPDADVITSHIMGEPYAETTYPTTVNPYPNRLYRMKQIVSILSANTASARTEQITRAIGILRNTYEVKLDESQELKLKNGFQMLPLDYVVGNPDNDSVPVMENEQAMYDNLIDFIKFHIKRFNTEVMVGASEAEIEQKSEQDFNNGVLPARLVEYLDQLLYDILNVHFYHTGNFNYIKGDFDDEEDTRVSYNPDKVDDDKMNIYVSKANENASDLHFVVDNYLSLSSKTFGASVWAEGIVKLMRWGDRKVKNLNVGINNTQYLDLQKMNLVTQQLADLSQFEVDSDDEGRTLDILVASFVDFKPEGERRAKSYPFLLAGKEYGKVPGVDDTITVTYVTTLFDIVRSYKAGVWTVYDLGYVDGRFVDEYTRSELITLDVAELTTGNRKIKISDELTDYAIDNNIPKMEGTALSVLRQEDFEDYLSLEPLLERLAETPKPMRSSLVQGGLLAVFQEGAEDYDNLNLVELLNWYQDNVYSTHLEGYMKLFGFSGDVQDKPQLNATNVKTAHFFTTAQEPEQEEETKSLEEEIPEFMYNIYEGPELQFNKIIRTKADETVIGGYAITPEGGRVFASVNEVGSFAVNGETLHTGQVLLTMFEVMLAADTHNPLKAKHQVISEDSVFSIYRAYKGI